jgi:hypothetical protein
MNNTEKYLKQLEAQKFDLLNEYHTHECSRDYCNPQNIEHVYLCKYRQIHICLPDTCDLINDGVCQLSGACYGPSGYSTYDHNDNRTWYENMDFSTPQRKQLFLSNVGPIEPIAPIGPNTIRRNTFNKEAIKKIESYIECLLYSPERAKMNAEHVKLQEKKSNRAKDIYINRCIAKNVPANTIELMIIEQQYSMIDVIIEVLPFDEAIITRYTLLIIRMHEIVQQYSDEKICLESLTLGTLYYMRQGLNCGGVEVIPIDSFLIKHLPEMNDLRRFGFDKKKYTRGEKWITYTYECATKKRDDLKKLKVN